MGSTLAAICFSIFLCPAPTYADSRGDWVGYDWRTVKPDACMTGSGESCALFHGKWDWKRDQWIDLTLQQQDGDLSILATLTNRDLHDDDYVCLTVLFQDPSGANLAVFHENVHSDPRTTVSEEGDVLEARLAMAKVAPGGFEAVPEGSARR